MKAIYGIIIIFNLCVVSMAYANSLKLTPDQEIVAMTILGEARNQGEAGMYAVACIIQKRAINRGISARAVCRQDWQFSCWNKNDPNRAKLPALLNNNNKQSKYAKRLALSIGKLETAYVNNADHYCALVKKPYWSYKTIIKNNKKIRIAIKPVKIIGQHKFYKLK
jgi:spore germination cell wall hydrolase CwlJ-like protein